MDNKVVYLHRKATNGEVFYVGMGNLNRPKSKERSIVWHRTVNKYGYTIEVIRRGLTKEDACSIEIDLIELIGRRDLGKGTLVNLTDGGDGIVGSKHHNKRVFCLDKGIIYKSIKDYCEERCVSHGTVSTFLRRNLSGLRDYSDVCQDYRSLRFLDGNNIVWMSDELDFNEVVEGYNPNKIDYINNYDYDYDSLIEDRVSETLNTINHLDEEFKAVFLILTLTDCTIRELAKISNTSLTIIYSNLNRCLYFLNPNKYSSKVWRKKGVYKSTYLKQKALNDNLKHLLEKVEKQYPEINSNNSNRHITDVDDKDCYLTRKSTRNKKDKIQGQQTFMKL
jgi:hypothetical protein